MRTRCPAHLVASAALALSLGIEALEKPDINDFNWASIPPSEDLSYHDCYDGFQCARLQLPLDWLNESDHRHTIIAMIKLPAIVSDDDETFGGPIITNPGGPGGSGVEQVLEQGAAFQNLTALPGKRNYEIVSFDPRGVGLTLPLADCFHDDELARDAFDFEKRGVGKIDGGRSTIAYSLAMAEGFANRCLLEEETHGQAMAYVNTPSVARDMVAMIDKIDELRKRNQLENEDIRSELRKRTYDDNKSILSNEPPRLQYIGLSYGTALGNYFASLFPGRVGRLLLDGVVNADDFSNGPGWLTNLVDTDKVMDAFFRGCFDYGASACPLLKSEDKSAQDTKARVWEWIDQLDKQPVAASDVAGLPVVISSLDILEIMGRSLYSPADSFRQLGRVLDQSMKGNHTELVPLIKKEKKIPELKDACQRNGKVKTDLLDTGAAIICGDGGDISDADVPWWEDYIAKQVNTSRIYGAHWSQIRFPCSRWPFRASWSFKGPFSSPEPAEQHSHPLPDQPAAPILFSTNRLDPVTPVKAARAMAKGHPNSRLVILEASGHCALMVPHSDSCVKNIVAEYFFSGTVPEENETICDGGCDPWDTDCLAKSTKSLYRLNSSGVTDK